MEMLTGMYGEADEEEDDVHFKILNEAISKD